MIKLDGVSDVQLGASRGYGRLEMAYYNMALACGIDMMPSRLLEENGREHFMTKGFDREGGEIKNHVGFNNKITKNENCIFICFSILVRDC